MFNWNDFFVYSEKSPLIFTHYIFLIFFTVAIGVFTLLYKNIGLRNIYLLSISLFFYYKSGGLYFWLLIFSTVVDYNLANLIFKASGQRKKWLLFLSLAANIGLLVFFKYSYFLVDNLNQVLGTHFKAYNFFTAFSNVLTGTHFDVDEIILPIGISFYTFQAMSYTIDVYRGRLLPVRNIWDFGFFISFFPHLVAGPIVRAVDFIPQIYKKYSLTREEFGYAIFLILNGLIKKVLISDYISINFVDRVFDNPQMYSGFDNLMAIYGYSLQIYCDFSGYSDMAIGLALLMGFRLGINFNSPYKSTSITEFWRRWHISLSSWLRDYLYVSLGGNRKGENRTYINLMITMLIGGLWHGASARFIIWGALHGAALCINKLWDKYVDWPKKETFWTHLLFGLITFHFVAFCWIFFRAEDINHVSLMLKQLSGDFSIKEIPEKFLAYRNVFILMAIGYTIHLLPEKYKIRLRHFYAGLPDVAIGFIFAVVIIFLYQIASSEIQPFIYFRF